MQQAADELWDMGSGHRFTSSDQERSMELERLCSHSTNNFTSPYEYYYRYDSIITVGILVAAIPVVITLSNFHKHDEYVYSIAFPTTIKVPKSGQNLVLESKFAQKFVKGTFLKDSNTTTGLFLHIDALIRCFVHLYFKYHNAHAV